MKKILTFIVVLILSSCSTQQAKDILTKLFFDGKEEFVDLGLSVKWATCNVGANSPEEYGDYYTFDAAQKLGRGGKRVPTDEEFQELIDNCTCTWTKEKGVKGYKVTSKKKGNSIFLPAAGFRNGTDVDNVGSDGDYWSSSANDYDGRADCLDFSGGYVYTGSYYRYYGFSVRLVQDVE